MAQAVSATKESEAVRMVDLIQAKRSGHAHSKEEIDFVVKGIMNSSIPDYQLAAWLMAVCWRGMTMDETAWLTDAMCKSGTVLDLSSIGSLVGDKHSTGGVGDKTTLVFVPLLAAAGIPMAKLSGRGLGHTGGTLDKMEAIPGLNVELGTEQFIQQVKEHGMAVGGQTQDLAPADGKIYALRDVTATVESIPLIAASVMSKKIAAGANLIILDVKCGRGAYMDTIDKAKELAHALVEVGRRLKRPVTAVVTDMEQPLGMAVGHTVEVIEAIETLQGRGPEDLHELCMVLGALALVKAGKAKDEKEAREKLQKLISSGAALENFRKLVKAQGGDPSVVENYKLMPHAKHTFEFKAPGNGPKWIKHLDGRKVSEACKLMGAGRSKKGEPINLAVGVVLKAKVGSKVEGGETIATVYADSQADYDKAFAKLEEAFTFSDAPVSKPEIIKASIS